MSLGEQRSQLSNREMAALVAFVAAAVGWGLNLKFGQTRTEEKVEAHTQQLTLIEVRQQGDHDILLEVRSEQKAQRLVLDYIATGRRGNPPSPAPISSTPTSSSP